ncbi:MAG: DUF255 domain-containing protein [Candidatus Obscuribacterales bacterium]|nr:DUF255 domain-containing protein [Candidatus Obscuribacterales bacterium]
MTPFGSGWGVSMKRITAFSLLIGLSLGFSAAKAEEAKDGLEKRPLAAAAEAHESSLVHWGPWTNDLFERAQKEKKLVILDLEAIWCHWCHVMDQKTYSNPEIAKIMQEHFIAVKVDQDSRPDLSNRYEDYGWPATIFFDSKGQELAKRSGFIEPEEMRTLLESLVKNPVPEEAQKKSEIKYSSTAALSKAVRSELYNNHRKYYDKKAAGWQTVHKFLDADSIEYAMTLAKEDADSLESSMAKNTLIAQINLIDPVWGGVYQYSTGGDWKHQHFEKIMSVQGENLRIYSLAYLFFKDARFLTAAENIERYLRSFLLSPEGAFYTSQDADVKQGQHSGDYFKLDDTERRKQGIPRIDKHIYARENGWAIAGLAGLYMATANKRYLDEAEKAANWILSNRSLPGGGFKHDANDSAGPYLGDTLFMGRAMLSLYQATGNREWLAKAQAAADFINAHFKNSQDKAGFLTSDPASSSLQKPEPLLDENVPLARFSNLLYHYSGNETYKQMAENCMRYLATDEIAHYRKMMVAGILLCDREISKAPAHITIVGAKSDPAAQALFQAANQYPVGYKRVEWYDPKEGKMPNADTDYPEMPKAAAFACANQRCSLPVYNGSDIAAQVDRSMNLPKKK